MKRTVPMFEKKLTTAELEDVYDLIAEGVDAAGPDKTPLFLAKLSLALANLLGDRQAVEQAVTVSLKDL